MFHRCLSPNKFFVYENDNLISSTASKLDFQKQLEDEVLGVDFKTFMNLIYTNPNSSVSILKAKKQDKRQFLERMFDLGYFSELSKRVQKKLVKNQENIAEVEKEIYKSESIIEVIKKDLDNLILPDLTKYKEEINELEKQLHKLSEDGIYNNEEELLEKYITQLDDFEKEKQKYEKLHQAFFNKSKQLNRKIPKLESNIKEYISFFDDDKTGVSISQIDLNIEELKHIKIELQNNIDDIKAKDKENDIKLSEVVTHIKILKDQYASYKDQELNVKPGDVCPTCSKEMDEKHYEEYINNQNKIKAELKEKINAYLEKLKKLKDFKNEYEQKWKKDNKELSSIEEDLSELNTEKEEAINFINKRDEIISLHDNDKKKLDKYTNIIIILERYNSKYLTELIKIQEEYELLKSNIDKLQKKIKDKDIIINNIERKRAVLTEQENQLEKNKEIKAEKEKNLKELQDKIDKDLEKRKKSLFTLKDYLVYFKDMLKDEEVKQYAIGEIIPFLTKQANHYLSQAGYEYYLDIDNWLDITIKGPGVKDSESGNMSGGEEKSIDLSLQYAFLDLIYSKSLTFPDLLIQDEILDSSIDSESLENFLDIVKAKQRENNLSLYIISHRKEIDLINPDHVIEVEKVNGFSKIKES